MMNSFEENVMVKPINEANNFGRIEASKRAQEKPATRGNNVAQESNDIVNFSDVSKQMSALKAIIANVPEVNTARVEFLREEYLAGRYEANSKRIAARMVADVEMA